jgi:hypothetical protein
VLCDGSVGGGYFQAKGEQRGECEREPNAADTGRPADPVEDLVEDGGADQAAGEVAGEIDAARRSAIRKSSGSLTLNLGQRAANTD